MARSLTRNRNKPFLHITDESFLQIEEFIRWSETVGSAKNFNFGMNALVMFMAYTNLGIAQKMSAGPVDPQMNNAAAAWKVPVRRITEDYFYGWKVRRLSLGTWQLYNDSREAYFIEFGIHVGGARVRRPIRKLSLLKTLRALESTAVYHRVWAEIYTAGHKHFGFSQTVQSPVMGTFFGPGLGRRLP
jgi:hypothetical protein